MTTARSVSAMRHLVVLCHGLAGTPTHLAFIKRCLEEYHGDDDASLLLHTSTANHGILSSVFSTADGVDTGGARLAAEIRQLLSVHAGVTHLSLVGVSLGGLYARAALAHLEDLDSLSFSNYISFATPHLGVRGHLPGALDAAVSAGAIGATGRQLLLQDPPEVRDGCGPDALPLLAWMAHPASPHHRVLRRFVNKVLVANIENDDKVPYWSAALARDPGVLAALSASGSGVVRRLRLPAPGTHGHVTAVYRQAALFPDAPLPAEGAATAGAAASDGASASTPTLPSTHSAWAFAGAAEAAAPLASGSLEAAMAAHLRSIGGWATVDVLFSEWPAYLFNHARVAVTRSWVAGVGADVPRFVCRHLFEPPPPPTATAAPPPLSMLRRAAVVAAKA